MPPAADKSQSKSFSAVLETMQRSVLGSDNPPPHRPSSGAAGQPADTPAYVPQGVLARLYEAVRSSARQPASTPPPSTKPDDIARELAIGAGQTVEDLLGLRRRFAFSNHPDRVAAALREIATIRMSIANTLIDRALAARRRSVSPSRF